MIYLFESSTCFEQLCAHPQEDNCINTHSRPKHVEDSNKHITEEIVRHVGYLPELYENARSENKILPTM